ncbi:MAG: hypothetical protein FWE80_06180 [Oscillospiraceae bacterium]|nr:hypothetical protein [Oscillospiraceae bacterium]
MAGVLPILDERIDENGNKTIISGITATTWPREYPSSPPRPIQPAAESPAPAADPGLKPAAYQTSAQTQGYIDDTLDRIMNRGDFSYDPAGDRLYQLYADQFRRDGQQAMQNTMGAAAGLTGGFGNSYGATAGAAAYNQSLARMNEVMPQLEQAAYSRWRDDEASLYNQMGLLTGLDDRDYGRSRDALGDWKDDRNFDRSVYESDRAYEFNLDQAEKGWIYKDRELAENARQFDDKMGFDRAAQDIANALEIYKLDTEMYKFAMGYMFNYYEQQAMHGEDFKFTPEKLPAVIKAVMPEIDKLYKPPVMRNGYRYSQADVDRIMQAIVGKVTLSDEELDRYSFSGKKKKGVNINDARLLMQALEGKIKL